MDAGKGKSGDFRLSQALANPVVQKGVCGDFILYGLSPPVSPRRKMVSPVHLLDTQVPVPSRLIKSCSPNSIKASMRGR